MFGGDWDVLNNVTRADLLTKDLKRGREVPGQSPVNSTQKRKQRMPRL